MYIYIYIYIERERETERSIPGPEPPASRRGWGQTGVSAWVRTFCHTCRTSCHMLAHFATFSYES